MLSVSELMLWRTDAKFCHLVTVNRSVCGKTPCVHGMLEQRTLPLHTQEVSHMN